MKIVFRVDASLHIGTGHVMRCLTLAQRLRQEGAAVFFICRDLPGNMCSYLAHHDVDVRCLPLPVGRSDAMSNESSPAMSRDLHASWLGVSQAQDAFDTWQVIARLGSLPDWLIVDHYALDIEWERELRPYVGKIMAIDDVADRIHDCDLLLDQNLQGQDRYSALVPKTCRALIGPKYALLRPQFATARGRLRMRDGRVSRLLVFFGGADIEGETLKALSAIESLGRSDLAVDVVIGQANPHRVKIEAACRTLPNATLYSQVEDMATRMVEADLFVGAGGISSWERCCLGLPALVLATADNQIAQSKELARAGAQLYLGSAQSLISEHLARLIEEVLRLPELLTHMSKQGCGLVDSRGVGRVANHILAEAINLRRAEMSDCNAIHNWRNHPETRRFSFNPHLIDWETHERWFTAVLNDPNRELLIAEQQGRQLGVLRYDIADGRALISIYLVPGLTGQGWGKRILLAGEKWLRGRRQDVRVIEAEIDVNNLASVAAFQVAGYQPERSLYRKKMREDF